MKHTPTPWAVVENDGAYMKQADNAKYRIEAQNPQEHVVALIVSDLPDDVLPAEANAAFIVRACNAHDQLVEALKQVMGWISNWSPNFETDEEWQTVAKPQILAAIAKAEAQS
ncbi:hypothetical protein ACSBOB_20050 [Mesorhizobium sp. ASY16-5R]|uniref:hypothetical protein n=1 Tax=Mesorhizobium sp. ASY16-5R TaxID=3445772 RepID=UPI003F9F0D78